MARCRVVYLYQGAEEDEAQAAERAGKAAYDRVLAKVLVGSSGCCPAASVLPLDQVAAAGLKRTHAAAHHTLCAFSCSDCLHSMHPAAACEQACRSITALRHFLPGSQQRQAVASLAQLALSTLAKLEFDTLHS
jgi:hypothetical protein